MKIFGRKQDSAQPENVPTEVQDYYQAERRERVGLAWVLGLFTLLVTFAVVFGAFIGGRAIYRKIAHSSKNKPTAVVQQVPSATTEQTQTPSNNGTTSTPSTSGTSNTTPATPPATNTPSPTTSTPSSTSSSTPSATSSSTLPHTGPEGDD